MKRAFPTLIALAAMIPAMASATITIENVLISSYRVGSGRAVPYDVEIREQGDRLLASLSHDRKILARDLPVEVSKCREGRIKPTGKFVRPRRNAQSLQLHFSADYGQSAPGRTQFCEIVLDDLPLGVDQPDPQASPPNPGRPGQPPPG